MKFLLSVLLFPSLLLAQTFGNSAEQPILMKEKNPVEIPSRVLIPDKTKFSELSQTESGPHIVASGIKAEVAFQDFKLTKVLSNGDKIYQYQLGSEGALGLRVQFEAITMHERSKIWIYNAEKTEFIGSYSKADLNKTSMLSSIVHGSSVIIEVMEPKDYSQTHFEITYLHHFFRGLKSGNGFGSSQSCMINVACSEGNNYSVEQLGVCKIVVVGQKAGSPFTGYCTGTLMNNTREDAAGIILTANHCSEYSSIGNLPDWEFHFYYQSPTCMNPSSEPSFIRFKGSSALAYSGSDNGTTSSDFLLLKLSQSFPTGYDPTYLGWDRTGANANSGACIHQPDGDIKKISTFNTPTTVVSYNDQIPTQTTHFQVYWAITANGHSVTQGGSSGSALLNQSKLVIGTLTGGASNCSPAADKFKPDFYGRLARHWSSWGTDVSQRVDIYLDPVSGGAATTLRTIKKSQAKLLQIERLFDFNFHIANGNIFIDWNNLNYTVRMYNLVGQEVYHTLSNQHEAIIPISNLPKGIYILETEKNGGRSQKKIEL